MGSIATSYNGHESAHAPRGENVEMIDAKAVREMYRYNRWAARAGLNERYVREWLGAKVTSGVISVDPQSVRYHLPPEHAAYLTRAAGPSCASDQPNRCHECYKFNFFTVDIFCLH
jgi:hypothetical protein